MTATKRDVQVSISGPFTKKASGKFAADGETPIKVSCPPYWVVRFLRNTVLTDERHTSKAAADARWAELAPFGSDAE